MDGTALMMADPAGVAGATRRRAAVAFADIVGYTILMGADPARTHARWMQLLFYTLRPLARARGSAIVKSTGDGMLADFPTVADALAWADAVHQAVRLSDRPDQPPVAFRIAIAVGEIDATADDIYGECVNVAARLQEHAPPGGIALTEAALAELSQAPELESLGALRLRNIIAPVQAFARAPDTPPRLPARAPALGTPSVAVLPFLTTDGAPGEAYFGSGIIEDIVLSLGGLRDLAVTARGATLGWMGGPQDPRTIGRVLGVRYVVTGRLRRGPEHLRLDVQLRQTEDDEIVWSDRLEANMRDLFALQDEIVARVVAGVAPGIRAAELRRALRAKPASLTAYDRTLRGMHALDMLRRESFGDAGQHFAHALQEDPGFAMAASWASRWHSFAYAQGWSDKPERDRTMWAEMALQAVHLDPQNAMGNAMMGHHRAYVLHDPAEALTWFDQALAACPNHAPALSLKSGSLAYLGRGQEALQLAERAFALSPVGSDRYYYLCYVGIAHLAAGNSAAAVTWLRRSLADNPEMTAVHRYLIAALDAMGAQAEAQAVAKELLRLEPGLRLGEYAATRQPFIDAALRAQMLGGLRRAGVPD
jgi:adenylate cyclase